MGFMYTIYTLAGLGVSEDGVREVHLRGALLDGLEDGAGGVLHPAGPVPADQVSGFATSVLKKEHKAKGRAPFKGLGHA